MEGRIDDRTRSGSDDGAWTPLHTDVEALADALSERGWVEVADALTARRVDSLSAEIARLHAHGRLRPARTGRGAREIRREAVRGDEIAWLDASITCDAPAMAAWLEDVRALGTVLGAALRTPVSDFDGHVARYAAGTFYRPHVDAPIGASRRLLSLVQYLDADWRPEHGGRLRLWPEPSDTSPAETAAHVEIAPRAGTLVIFRSAGIWHEVRPTTRPRVSLTGWFLSST